MELFNWRSLHNPLCEKADDKQRRMELTAQVMTDPEMKESGRRACMNNRLALSWVLGYTLISLDVHHEALGFFPEIDANKTVEELAKGIKRRRSLILPRGTYKSTLDIVYCVQLILHYFMTISILILSGGRELAFDFVNEVASFFVHPPRRQPTLFQVIFPELCVPRQKASGEFTTAQRQFEPKIIEPLIWGSSVDSSTTGWHPDVLILDDVHNNRNSTKFESRERITKAYKLTRKILKPTGIEIKIGTTYGMGDIFNDEVLTSRPDTYDRVYKPALRLKSGERLDANGFPEAEDVELLFPTILSYDMLREEYESDYTTFMSQYALDPYGASEIVFEENEILNAVLAEDKIPMEGHPRLAFRLPCLTQNWATFSGAAGLLFRDRMYVVEIVQGHYKPSAIAKLILTMARHYSTHNVEIEASSGAASMQPILENYALTTGWALHITWTEGEEDAGERDTRIRNIEVLIATSRLIFSAGVKIKPLIAGFVQYGMNPETGIPDVISRLCASLPTSIASEELEQEDAWRMMRERDWFNLVYNRTPYAPAEPEPEETPEPEPRIEDQRYTEHGLEIEIPGLEY